ncbi:YdaU family protein (plasmid) [Skermanella rosea]|uniref:YdaU family protein n=1 Tax=Skermanella rosea TaxID=1817965 RepID=UPI001932E6DE|nr:YdaU family protein [Skermanella rosea]UEM08087.1 YdaU family protein [Skermanella rosea]
MTQPWYPFYWGDYSAKTLHLTQAQHGAFILLLRYIYTTGKPIPDEHRFSIARASLEQERSDVDFVLTSFFTLIDGVWRNQKAEEIITEAEQKHEARVKAGKKGGKRKASNAKAKPKPGSTNHNHNHNLSSEDKSSSYMAAAETRAGEPEAETPEERIARATRIVDWISDQFGNRYLYISAPVIAWLNAGADFEADIVPVIKRHIADGRDPPRRSLSMFDQDITASISKRTKPLRQEEAHGNPAQEYRSRDRGNGEASRSGAGHAPPGKSKWLTEAERLAAKYRAEEGIQPGG